MKTLITLLATTSLLFALSACGEGSPNNGGGAAASSAPSSNAPTFTDAEQTGDLQNLNAIEKGLADVGLKFKTAFDYVNGVTTTTYSWNMPFLQDFEYNNPSISAKDMIPALQKYVKAANSFTQKYAGTFNIKNSDGTVTLMKIVESVKSEIGAKVDVANKTISNLQGL